MMTSSYDSANPERLLIGNRDLMEDSDEGWQSNTKNIPQRLNRLFYFKDFSDLIIVTSDGSEMQVHKLILAIHSPVFERMFFGSIPYKERKIKIIDISPIALKWIISYMYLGIITLENFQMAIEIYTFAHEKQIDVLVARCSKFLSGKVTVENSMMLMNMANIYDDEELKAEAIFKMFEKRASVFTSTEIGAMPKSVLLDIVSREKIFCTEKDIFTAIYNWAKLQIQRRGESINKVSIRLEMEDFLPFVHFLFMNSDYFICEVMKTGILTSEESIAILNAINRRTVQLPNFVSRERTDRFFRRENCLNMKISINKFTQCNVSFIFNHNHDTYSDKILTLKVTENAFIKSIAVRQGCFTGSWKLKIFNTNEKELGVSSNDFSPWNFEEMIPVMANRYYSCVLRGRGKRVKHNMQSYESDVNNIGFSGYAISCSITIHFCV